jgi:two-component system, OmpR family, sensor histidine kinase SenX3
MQYWSRDGGAWLGLAAVLALVLAALAVLQYQWATQVSASQQERLGEDLAASVRRFRDDFTREIRAVGAALEAAGPVVDEAGLVPGFGQRLEAFPEISVYSGLLGRVVLIEETTPGAARAEAWTRGGQAIEEIEAPPALVAHLRAVWERVRFPVPRRRGFRGPDFRFFIWTSFNGVPLLVIPAGGPGPPPERLAPGFGREFPWTPPASARYVLLELDTGFLSERFLPGLIEDSFGPPETSQFQAVVATSGFQRVLYGTPGERSQAWDVTTPLMVERPESAQHEDPARPGPPLHWLRRGGGFPILAVESDVWTLFVRHREGSLAAATARLRRWNLALGFGILGMLAASMALMVVSARRAERLAKLKMGFVTSVSHELRTPLSVISAAADNLAAGVSSAPDKVRQYGSLIREESRKLARMVENVLEYASADARRNHLQVLPVRAEDAIRDALAETHNLLESRGFQAEQKVEPDLPPVSADAAALQSVLVNLISNAVKYGPESRWLRIGARRVNGQQVAITVEDRGPGIEEGDLPYIFEPFYRGRGVASSAVHGAGLGLSLAKDAVERMGGQIKVESEKGRGSNFSVVLRVDT